ncbi:uncharacterized protein LOC125493275 [Beta vulgaris subsp. vulgaris]|uniref:uncharacterized protein LOC125493275 n=1 Tax=Beta vulgaris subsp. vulgaris TaxID=3555 RepID=UPI0025470F4D|nr:uncharacterized protein LOC125493275 [Beta vulgaris subsp. vulgaris]
MSELQAGGGSSATGAGETRVREQNASKVQKKLGKEWVWVNNYSHSTRGRIWIGWRPGWVNITVTQVQEQFMHQDPMIIIGDFNAVCNANDRLNGTLITDAETEDFQNFLLQSSLIESKSTGAFYSWSNSSVGSDRVVSRIDKAFVNQAWLSMYTAVAVEYLAPGVSDHSTLKFALMAGNVQGGRPFKFLNIMAEQEDFLRTVDKAWSSVQGSSRLQSIWLKLKAVKRDLKVMKKQKMGIAQDKVEVLRHQITELQTQGDYDSNAEAQLYVKGLLKDLNHWSHVEESILHQKSRINWLKQGDANTKLFFTAIKARHGQNRIELIVADDGRMVKGAGARREEILDFYKKLLGTRATRLQGVDLNVVREGPSLSNQAKESLMRVITNTENE